MQKIKGENPPGKNCHLTKINFQNHVFRAKKCTSPLTRGALSQTMGVNESSSAILYKKNKKKFFIDFFSIHN